MVEAWGQEYEIFSFQSNTKEEEKSYKWNAKFTRAVGGGFRGGG